jgi:elongation factor P|uniref:Elongation factor P n=1 Tax=candidate division WOR-3 bacterium TaxID=2052148 RepID=A0A7C6E9D8_UNCW3
MILASEIRTGATIKLDNELYRVIEAEFKAGTAKMGSLVHLRLQNIKTRTFTDRRFHPEEKLEDVTLERVSAEFSYQNGENFYFLHPETYEPIGIEKSKIGNFERFLVPGMYLKIEFYEGMPVDIVIPKTVDLRVESTGAGVKGETDAAYKPAKLENGIEIMVPQFIKNGDIIRIEVETNKYLERVKG